MFYDPSTFSFASSLEQEWRSVRDEFLGLRNQDVTAWPERYLYDGGWDVFRLWGVGEQDVENCARCPKTAGLVASIPGMQTAGFSVLRPGTHIRPHVGYSPAVLRCHLGLVVPEGCEMRVGTESRGWVEGKALIFDDTVEHEVWHRGTSPRVVLLVDFTKPSGRPMTDLELELWRLNNPPAASTTRQS